jgi:ubiquinone/menaquinone biosynthesis C-methylase UbiE
MLSSNYLLCLGDEVYGMVGGVGGLMIQAAILRPVTERLLGNVKITTGMRVLDLGCGAGDVSFLAAKFVGPEGLVIGIDRSQEVLNLAAKRAKAAGLPQI